MNTLFKPTSYQKGAFLAVSATLVWKIISFANALLLALYFGATRQTDVYFYLIMLIGFGVAFLQRLNQTVLIPEAMFLAQKKPQAAQSFLTMWFYLYLAAGLLVISCGVLWAQPLWQFLSRFKSMVVRQDTWLLQCGCVLFALQILTYYLTAVAEMYKFFKTAWLGILSALCPLACLLLFGHSVGIISMVYGFLAAHFIQLVVLVALLKTQLNWHFIPAFVPLRKATRQHMLSSQTLAVLDTLNSLVPVYLISGMGPGLISALNYCKQFTDSTTEVFTSRVANVAKIEMTEQAATRQRAALNNTFVQGPYLLLIFLAPLAVFSCHFAPQIVQLFLQRGQFDTQAAYNTVLFLRPMLFTLLLAVPGYLQNSALAATRKIKQSFPYALINSLVLLALMLIYIPLRGGFIYPYLIGAGLLVGFLVNVFLFGKHLPFLDYTRPLWLIIRFTFLAIAALIPAAWLSVFLPPTAWGQILLCGCLFVGLYTLLLGLTKDLQRLIQLFQNGF